MSSQDVERLTARLAARLPQPASAAQRAQAIHGVCLGMQDALTPILGARGVAALFTRSLQLCAARFPALQAVAHGHEAAADAAALRTLLARLDDADAAAGGLLFLQTFDGLLVSLIGSSLSERLLQPVWQAHTGSPPFQDISHE